jgi:cation diffusion facilitator CzcD-associated flavoprotein CzcO
VVVFEKNRQVGGNWIYSPEPGHSSVFESTHMISSRALSEYLDYPMPAGYPDYPGHVQLLEYFQGYARRFGLLDHIRFGADVRRAEPAPGGGWTVTLASGESGRFDHLLVASGHHWDPRLPSYPGTFAGRFLHAHDFKTSAPFRGQRVLVVGGGNSGCDIAVETCRVSSRTAISLRRGYYFVPKFLCGVPTDVLYDRFLFLPRRVRVKLMKLALRLAVGSWSRYGLPEPDHELLASHPVVNSELLYLIRHGRIQPRPDVERFEGRDVRFVDGTVEGYDAVVAATGFRIRFPFLDPDVADFSEGQVPLFLRVFHPERRDLFFIGLCQPLGCIWPLADLQSKVVASFITGRYRLPRDMAARIEGEVQATARRFMATPRHTIEVDSHEYRRALEREIPSDAPAWRDQVGTAARPARAEGRG